MDPTQLSLELRHGQSPDLKRRRWIIGLSLLGVAAGQMVSLYQTGIIKHLPDPPLDVFNSDKVDASDYAYKRMDTPDALLVAHRKHAQKVGKIVGWLEKNGREDLV